MPRDVNDEDPFLVPRDVREEAINRIVREFCLRAVPSARTFRQEGTETCYALIVSRLRGERLLTVPALQEADFMFHGNPGTTSTVLADFIARSISDSGADHLRLPLLSRCQAEILKSHLGKRLPTWRLETALAAVSPLAQRVGKGPSILWKAIARSKRDGFILEVNPPLEVKEIRALHEEQWGSGNRGDFFFQMLDTVFRNKHAELVIARNPAGNLVAAQIDFIGSATRHCYYAISDKGSAPGCGTAVLGVSWRRFAETEGQDTYSFGRGAERYKYQYANCYRELFELRGFYAPGRAESAWP